MILVARRVLDVIIVCPFVASLFEDASRVEKSRRLDIVRGDSAGTSFERDRETLLSLRNELTSAETTR